MLLEKEADAVARVGDGVPLRLLHHRAGGDAPERSHIIKPDLGDAVHSTPIGGMAGRRRSLTMCDSSAGETSEDAKVA